MKRLIQFGVLLSLSFLLISFVNKPKRFNMDKDLLLGHFDCKTDVDDIHSAAAFYMLFNNKEFEKINFHAVAGTYGVQDGLYVPPNELFELAFKKNWTDAHKDFDKAVERVKKIALKTLNKNGNIWIADAGQSDFSAALIKAILKEKPEIDLTKRINIVQHSEWNEKVTSEKSLNYVKNNISYHKIPDGNVVGNGSPGLQSSDFNQWKSKINDENLDEIWSLAVEIGQKYNGVDGRYNNEAIGKGGLDFSDICETCYILNIDDIVDVKDFFNRYSY
ncbi:MAG: hypothetical protein BM563_03735 [Bacteroidetes bacterium MedPE-SWsnd-G1]|nr:MAG: hypothetical protein BM563_03735 [Bacteroidetes bacterium MedPE-SWsnd-G1]